jgi:hypothetical protein
MFALILFINLVVISDGQDLVLEQRALKQEGGFSQNISVDCFFFFTLDHTAIPLYGNYNLLAWRNIFLNCRSNTFAVAFDLTEINIKILNAYAVGCQWGQSIGQFLDSDQRSSGD